MRTVLRVILLSLASTIGIIVAITLTPKLLRYVTYPFMLIRGTERFEGETKFVEIFFISDYILTPIIFVMMILLFSFLRWRKNKIR